MKISEAWYGTSLGDGGSDGISRSDGAHVARVIVLAAALALAGCASAPPAAPVPAVVTQTVEVPVPVKCKPQLGAKPAFGDSDAELKAKPGAEDRYQALAVARPLHYAWEAVLEAALKGCAG